MSFGSNQTLFESKAVVSLMTLASCVATTVGCIGNGVTSHLVFDSEHLLEARAAFDFIVASVDHRRRVGVGFAMVFLRFFLFNLFLLCLVKFLLRIFKLILCGFPVRF